MSRKTCLGARTACAVATLLALLVLLPAGASARSQQFGAFTPGDPYTGTSGAAALEAATGRRVDIVNWYQNWGGGNWISSMQSTLIATVLGSGRTPLLTWEPWAPDGGTDQPTYALSRIANGSFDGYISAWAIALKVIGAPVHLRPMHEMNGNWYPWNAGVNGNTPATFVQAWRRIVDIFRDRGAGNVRFVWSPNNIDVPAANRMESFYPGDGYVDVLAVDGYNWGAGTPEFGGWQSFSKVFMNAYDRLRALGPQPIWIAEVATSDDGGDKAAWVRDMFARAATMDRLEALVWFNENKERDWRAAPTPEVAAAFAPGAAAGAADAGAAAVARRPRLTLMVARRARAGRKATVRWRATGAARVTRWLTYLNGSRVRTVSHKAPRIAQRYVGRPGRYRWKVVGRDGQGHTVVSASRAFRVVR
jgi:hypothetical protein